MKRTAKPFFVVGGGEVLADIMNFFQFIDVIIILQ
jgi:hypothetical protein